MVGNSTAGRGATGRKGVGRRAGQDDGGDHQRGGDGALDEGAGEAHLTALPVADWSGGPVVTWTPGPMRDWPAVTTCSPSFTPSDSTAWVPSSSGQLDLPLLDRLVRLDHEDEQVRLPVLDGLVRHRDAVGDADLEPGGDELARGEPVIPVVEQRLEHDRAGAGVDGVVSGLQDAAAGRRAAVGRVCQGP